MADSRQGKMLTDSETDKIAKLKVPEERRYLYGSEADGMELPVEN